MFKKTVVRRALVYDNNEMTRITTRSKLDEDAEMDVRSDKEG